MRPRPRYLFITIMLFVLSHAHPSDGQLTTQAPPRTPLPDTPSTTLYPFAYPVPEAGETVPLTLDSATQSEHNGVFSLDGDVLITFRDHQLRADHIDYDSHTGDLVLAGHLLITGGTNHERIAAARGTFNLKSSTGRFFDVTGSVGLDSHGLHPSTSSRHAVYTSGNPFLFSGRMVTKTGPQDYEIFDGTVTACQLPHPDWLLSAAHFTVDGEKARATNSVFHLLNVPILYLPYITNPVDPEVRQSGFLIPTIGRSGKKGIILGEDIYLVINRSMDLVVGAEYFSLRGFSQTATFRYRGPGLDFATIHYSGLLDRRSGSEYQGGKDTTFAGRYDLSPATRAAANVEYLSSYIYREAFTDNFNEAVTSDIISTAYITTHTAGFELSALADRYQGIKRIAQGPDPQQEVHIFHAPTLALASTDHSFLNSPLRFTLDASAAGLKRSQPNFATSGIVERFDLHPALALPLNLRDWHIRPEVALRETIYTRSRVPVYLPGVAPVESLSPLFRSAFEFQFGVRPPVLTRTFQPSSFSSILGTQLRHTIEPELTYRLTTGVSDFLSVLRFDDLDVFSNANEAEYGITQRLFRRAAPSAGSTPCRTAEIAEAPGLNAVPHDLNPAAIASTDTCGSEELISWRLTQKYFFDPTFGAAILRGRRNILASTLDLSGVAFLTEPRNISPLISRLRVRTSARTDVEWDFDLDPGGKKFTSSNVFLDLHQGNTFAALSYARLHAPGRSYSQSISSTVSDFEQMRVLLGYGQATKPGLSVAANAGFDLIRNPRKSAAASTSTPTNLGSANPFLQYATLQTAYNWNCCGVSVEYRKFELGSVRNDGSYRFSFTLANIGTAGTLRRAERLF